MSEVVLTVPDATIDVTVAQVAVDVTAEPGAIDVSVAEATVDVSVAEAIVEVTVEPGDIEVSVVEAAIDVTAGFGITDHGDLTGLGGDDHPQYLTEERGDARYAPLAQRVDVPVPASVWVIDPGFPCHVVVYDSSGRVVEPGSITATGLTELTLTFSAPFSGVAYCYS